MRNVDKYNVVVTEVDPGIVGVFGHVDPFVTGTKVLASFDSYNDAMLHIAKYNLTNTYRNGVWVEYNIVTC